MKKLEGWILHPFLFGIYPVVALLAHNIRQIVPLFGLRSLFFALVLTLVTLLVARLVMGNWRKAALVTTLAMLLFFTYGRLFVAIRGIYLFGFKLARHRLLFGLFGVILIGFSWMVYKKKNLLGWTRTLNLIGIIAVLLPVFQIAWYEIRTSYTYWQESIPQVSAADLGLSLPPGESPPDIYYIVLDTYTRADAMQVNFDFDNSVFIDALTQKGFYVAACSRSNFASTYPSFTSFLNFNYLSDLNPEFVYPTGKVEDLYLYLQHNLAMQILTDLGYKTVAFDSGYSPTDFRDVDYYYSPQTDAFGALTISGLNPFEVILMQTSAGASLYDYSLNRPDLKVFFDYSYILYRNRMAYAMDKLPETVSLQGPKFVFVHLLAPHNPFAFGENGEMIIRQFPFTLDDERDVAYPKDYATGYAAEVTYLNTRFQSIFDQILQNSPIPPIIIVQGDHGIPRIDSWHLPILNAYYLPENGVQSLYPTISPVNTFRVIFNAYFGGQLEILPDLACDSPEDDPFHCVVVPDPNPTCIVP